MLPGKKREHSGMSGQPPNVLSRCPTATPPPVPSGPRRRAPAELTGLPLLSSFTYSLSIVLHFPLTRPQFGESRPCFTELRHVVLLSEMVTPPRRGGTTVVSHVMVGPAGAWQGSLRNDWVSPDGMEFKRLGAGQCPD